MPLDFESGVRFFGFDEASDETLARVTVRPLMTCPYCGCECDPSAVGEHAIDCEGYGENARTGPDEPD